MMGRARKHRKDLPQRVYQKHGAYYFVDRANKWHPLGRELSEAMPRYAELNVLPSRIHTLGQIFDRYQREVLPTKALKTQADQTRQLARLRSVFGHMRPDSLQPVDIYGYLDRRPHVAGRHEKGLLSHVFSCAIRWGLATRNPCYEVRAERRARTPARYLTDEEYRLARERAPTPLGEAMDLALVTGLRLGDVLALRRQDCGDDGLRVRVRKTGADMLFEWTPALRAAVDAARNMRDVGSMYLICTRQGQRYTAHGFKAMWQRWQQQLAAEGFERFRFHDLRRKAAKDAETALGREHARQLLGHASDAMTAKYVGGIFRVRPVR